MSSVQKSDTDQQPFWRMVDVPKGTGFYTLRRTAATMAARSGDAFAVQRLLGHANLLVATRCVQDVSKQTDEVIAKSRMYIV